MTGVRACKPILGHLRFPRITAISHVGNLKYDDRDAGVRVCGKIGEHTDGDEGVCGSDVCIRYPGGSVRLQCSPELKGH